MSNQTQEALKMAIEAMERAEEVDWELNSLHVLNILQAIQACKEALAQQAQEPVAYELWKYGRPYQLVKRADVVDEMAYKARLDGAENVEVKALYTHPAPSWQGLESEKVTQIIHGLEDKLGMPIVGAIAVARAIEQALKEKNT